MLEVPIQLAAQPDGAVVICGGGDGTAWRHDVGAAEVAALQQVVARLLDGFESGTRPLADPVALSQLGALLRDTYLAPLTSAPARPLEQAEGRLRFVSSSSSCLNLPWELLPGRDGRFLLADGRWAVRRSVRAELPETNPPLVARPLRILFAACAPQQPGMPVLDYERKVESPRSNWTM